MSNITEREGDLFDAPENAALIHACNCQGKWGKGIAEIFRKKYPGAYDIYRSHCQRAESRELVGTALLIPPQPEDYDLEYRAFNRLRGRGVRGRGRGRGRGGRGSSYSSSSQSNPPASKKHWIICLFTSWHYGSRVSPPAEILENTALALQDMNRQLEEGKEIDKEVELWSCRINAGRFGVPWEQSKQAMEYTELSITVISPGEE